MCGICGYVGSREAVHVLAKMTSVLMSCSLGKEGYGIVTVSDGKLLCFKKVGNDPLKDIELLSSSLKGSIGTGHNRNPSPGSPVGSENYLHPFFDCSRRIAVSHNGIVRNYKDYLPSLRDHEFVSRTPEGSVVDSEVIPHLIEVIIDEEQCSLEDAVVKVMLELCKGENVVLFSVLSALEPDRIYVASGADPKRSRSFLVARVPNEGTYFASYHPGKHDFEAFLAVLGRSKEVEYILLEHGCYAVLTTKDFKVDFARR